MAKLTEKMAVAIVDWQKLDGYRFVGETEIFTEGELFDQSVEWANGKVPKAVVLIHVKKIYTLQLGAKAGTLLAE